MKYYYEKPDKWRHDCGRVINCNHPLFNRCTLFLEDDLGIMVVQQRFDPKSKAIWWGSIDPWLSGDIYSHPGFKDYFYTHATTADMNGFYYIVPVRKLMWALRMKPMKPEFWENPMFEV